MNTNTQSKVYVWFKWTFIVLILVIISCFIYGVFLYLDTMENKTAGFEETNDIVIKETEITEIETTYRFQEKQEYHIVIGKTSDNKEKIVFVSLDEKKDDIIIIDKDEVLSKQHLKDIWQAECSNCELIKITPAMVNNKPLWEMTYKDNRNSYVIDYLSIYDGSSYEQFRFKQIYN